MKDVKDELLVDGVVVIECDRILSAVERNMLADYAKQAWPERKIVVLDKGMRISRDAQLARIEAKLDEVLGPEWVDEAARSLAMRIAGAHPAVTRFDEIVYWDQALGETHVREMLDRIVSGEVTGRKAHRWLGWAQCAAVCAGVGTLEDMKAINKAASDAAKAAR